MASSEGDSLKQTKEETSQTYNSLLEQQSDQKEHASTVPNRPDLSYSSPSTSPQDICIEAVSPDDTHVKEIDTGDLGGGARSFHPIQVEGQDLHHQNSHEQNEFPAETTLRVPKEERHRKSVQEDNPGGACSDTLDRPPSGEEVNYTRSSSSSSSPRILCEICSVAAVYLLCRWSKAFWETIEGSKCCEKVWQYFHNKLKEKFPGESALGQARVMNLLKALFGVKHSTDVVKFDKFVQLVRLFGPFRPEEDGQGCVILRQLEDLVKNSTSIDRRNKKKKKSWYGGRMSRGEAIAKLDGKSTGTFLVRISETEVESGSFSLDLVMADRQIEHFLLKGNPEKAIKSIPFSLHLSVNVGDSEETFSSLPKLVNHYRTEELFCKGERDNATMCTEECPDLPFNHIINGYSK